MIIKYLKCSGGILIVYLIVHSSFWWTCIHKQFKSEQRSLPTARNLENLTNASKFTDNNSSKYIHDKARSTVTKSNVNSQAAGIDYQDEMSVRSKLVSVEYGLKNTSSCSEDPTLIAFDRKTNPIFNGDYILNNKSICCGPTPITAIVVVHTAPNHLGHRNKIRATYGSRELFLPIEIRVVFLLGQVKTPGLQNEILREQSQYGDIIQGNFMDVYHNLTFKAVMGLHWVSHFCSKVKYVIKTDDDVMFDIWRFLKLINAKNLYVSKTIYGIINSDGTIFRGGKWAVDKDRFKGQKKYPFKFCNGFVLIYSSDVIPVLYRASYTVPLLWLDDVYVTGMLRIASDGINLINNGGNLTLDPDSRNGYDCLKRRGDDCPCLAVGVRESNFHNTWKLIKTRNHK